MNKTGAPSENKIVSVANWLAMGASVEDVRENLIQNGFSEYNAFLCIKAAETHNVMREREFPVEHG